MVLQLSKEIKIFTLKDYKKPGRYLVPQLSTSITKKGAVLFKNGSGMMSCVFPSIYVFS